jgi:hypothetical protein
MLLTAYRSLLCLYPESYRNEFGQEMIAVFREAQTDVSPAVTAKITFHQREFRGLLSGALRAHFERLFGPAVLFPRLYMKPQFRFPPSTVFLMCAIFGGVVLAINKAVDVVQLKQGLPRGSNAAWEPMLAALLLILTLLIAAAAAVWGVLFATRRTGMHRLQGMQTGRSIDSTRPLNGGVGLLSDRDIGEREH